jgi:hypothetical protein
MIRFSLIVCVIYLSIVGLLNLVLFLIARLRGGAGLLGTKTGWIILFSVLWLASLLISWRITGGPYARTH